jgi:hypothetical protein
MKQTKTTTPSKKPAATKTAASAGIGNLFDKGNYRWMLIGLGVMILGFLLMAGGRSPDPNVFDKNQVYSFRRITIAPIIILAGLAVMIFAIFTRPKTAK